MKKLVLLSFLTIITVNGLAASPELKTNDQLVSAVLASKKFLNAKSAAQSYLSLSKVSIKSVNDSLVQIKFKYKTENGYNCQIDTEIPRHFDNPTELISNCYNH